MAKAQPKAATAEAPGTDQAQAQQDGTTGTATDLTAVSDPATAGADTSGATPPTSTTTSNKPEDVCEVRVLVDVTIGETRYQANDVVEGVPGSVATAYAGSVDAHPDAVAYARSQDAPVKQFAE